jgi:phosphoglycerate dehydrogenase-like enzyme
VDETFGVGISRDFLKPDGSLGFGDIGLDLLAAAPGVAWEFLAENTCELRPDQIRGYDAIAILTPRVTATTLAGADRLAVVARYGVGYDSVDVDACTRHGVLLTITPDGVRRPMATAILTLMLALSQRLLAKDRLTRTGGWERKLDYMGTGLTGRVLGSIGLGNIGRELFTLAKPLEMRHQAHDPYVASDDAAALGVDLVDLDTLLRTSDVVAVNCSLTPETHHLLDADRLALMKPSAFLINTARGPIVDQAALTSALQERCIAGAGLDVFEREPVDPDDSILALDNVIVSPHALGWTDEWAYVTGRSAGEAILDVAAGRVPRYVVNRAAIDTPAVRAKLARYSARAEAR